MEKFIPVLVLSIVAITLLFSCKKESDKKDDCFPDLPTLRYITNKPAIIKHLTGDTYYIAEQGTIDNLLIPCNLPEEFKINDLQVTISGEVKATSQAGPGPCCREHFIITKISK